MASARTRHRISARTLGSALAFGLAVPVIAVATASAAGAAAPTPQSTCGSGYRTIDNHKLTGAVIYLTYNSGNGYNCVVTIKTAGVGSPTYTAATLAVQGDGSALDDGDYRSYAGPVRLLARGKCIRWGGAHRSSSWVSGWSHCG